jgi:hypothetical protein
MLLEYINFQKVHSIVTATAEWLRIISKSMSQKYINTTVEARHSTLVAYIPIDLFLNFFWFQ